MLMLASARKLFAANKINLKSAEITMGEIT